jgi:hypothetical protein
MIRTRTDGVAVVGQDLRDTEVADNNVLNLLETETEAGQDGGRVGTKDRGVRADIDLVGGFFDGTADDDDLGLVTLDGGSELGVRGDGGCGTAGTAGSTAVQAGIAKGGLDMVRTAYTLSEGLRRTSSTEARLLKLLLMKLLVGVGAARAGPRQLTAAMRNLRFCILKGLKRTEEVKEGRIQERECMRNG